MLTFIVVVSWWAVGVVGFVFWWTEELDFKLEDLLLGCVAGIMGPLTWAVGSVIHGQPKGFMSKVIIKKRDNG